MMCLRISPLKREGRITQRQESCNLSAVEDIHTAAETSLQSHTHTRWEASHASWRSRLTGWMLARRRTGPAGKSSRTLRSPWESVGGAGCALPSGQMLGSDLHARTRRSVCAYHCCMSLITTAPASHSICGPAGWRGAGANTRVCVTGAMCFIYIHHALGHNAALEL